MEIGLLGLPAADVEVGAVGVVVAGLVGCHVHQGQLHVDADGLQILRGGQGSGVVGVGVRAPPADGLAVVARGVQILLGLLQVLAHVLVQDIVVIGAGGHHGAAVHLILGGVGLGGQEDGVCVQAGPDGPAEVHILDDAVGVGVGQVEDDGGGPAVPVLVAPAAGVFQLGRHGGEDGGGVVKDVADHAVGPGGLVAGHGAVDLVEIGVPGGGGAGAGDVVRHGDVVLEPGEGQIRLPVPVLQHIGAGAHDLAVVGDIGVHVGLGDLGGHHLAAALQLADGQQGDGGHGGEGVHHGGTVRHLGVHDIVAEVGLAGGGVGQEPVNGGHHVVDVHRVAVVELHALPHGEGQLQVVVAHLIGAHAGPHGAVVRHLHRGLVDVVAGDIVLVGEELGRVQGVGGAVEVQAHGAAVLVLLGGGVGGQTLGAGALGEGAAGGAAAVRSRGGAGLLAAAAAQRARQQSRGGQYAEEPAMEFHHNWGLPLFKSAK